MNKEKREKANIYLKNWARAIIEMENLQIEINKLKRKESFLEDIYLEDKKEIEQFYKQKLEDTKIKLKNVIKNYKLVDEIIEQLQPYEQSIIKKRYISKMKWQQISVNVHISIRQCFNIKNNVMDKIIEKIEEEENK